MINRVILSLLFTVLYANSHPQKFLVFPTYDVDSILAILPNQSAEQRVNSLNKLAVSLSFIDAGLSKQYTAEAMKLSAEISYEEGVAEAYQSYGHIFQYEGNYPEALNNYLQALTRYKKLGKKKEIARTYQNIATSHYFAVNHEKVIEYDKLALDKYREKTWDGSMVGTAKDTLRVLGGIALIHFLTDSCEKSLAITLDYLELGKKNNFDKTDLYLYLILAGERFHCVGQLDSAKIYLEKAIEYPDENQNIETLKYRAVTSMGHLFAEAGNSDTAIIYYKRAYTYYREKGFLFWATVLSNSLGDLYFHKNQLDIADEYYHHAERTFKEMVTLNSWYRHDSIKHIVSWGMELYFPLPFEKMRDIMWRQGIYIYYMLYQIQQSKGKIDEALKYHISYANSKDTLNKIRRGIELIQLQTKYETERFEEEIETLSQENSIHELKLEQSQFFLFGLGGLVILVILVAIFIIRLNKLRDQQQNLILQQKLFRSQMNPHFIFNSLTSIQNFIMDAEAHKASKYLSRFAKLIRNILDSSIDEAVPLQEEISTIENYLELQQIRFKNKFDYFIEVGDNIKPDNINIPPMLAQPFIENAIEHGIKYKKSKGNIYIRFRLKNNYLVFEVEDDGVGRMQAKEILYKLNSEHKSLATAITHERIRALNRKRKQKITLFVHDLKDNNDQAVGTKVVLSIPINF